MPNRLPWLVIAVLVLAGSACSLASRDAPPPPATATPAPAAIAALPTSTSGSAAPGAAPLATAAPASTSAPACAARMDWPTLVVHSGDTLFGIALQIGVTVQDLVTGNCLSSADAIEAGQALRVPHLPLPPTLPTPLHLCPVQWFFMFVEGESDPLGTCPGAVIQVSAAGQDFEGGRAYWYAAPPGASDPRGTVWIIYNSGEWLTYPDTWQPGEMESDPGITPPGGRYQPVQRIGKVWRENADVRQRLGWAYTPPQPFTGRMQEPTGDSAAWAGHSHYGYLDHGAWGIVLRVYSVDMGPNLWEVAGRY